jgi:hypothetical protein
VGRMVWMTSRRPRSAGPLWLLAAVACGPGAIDSTPEASRDGGQSPGRDSAVAYDAAYANDATAAQDGSMVQDSAAPAAQSEAASDGPDAAGRCSVTSASSLPGVSIAFRSPVVCTFTLAQAQAGIAIPYDVVVASDVADVVPVPQDAGNCGAPGSSGLIVFEQLGGGGQSYCLCDTGLCPPGSLPPVTLHAGSYGSSFGWSGRNWAGASDTGNPMGAAFPAGNYALSVSAKGTQGGASFVVTTTLTIHLTP